MTDGMRTQKLMAAGKRIARRPSSLAELIVADFHAIADQMPRPKSFMQQVIDEDGHTGPVEKFIPWFRDPKKILAAADRIRRQRPDKRRTWTPIEEALLRQGWVYFRQKLRSKGRKATDEQIAMEIARDSLFAHRDVPAMIRHHQRLIKKAYSKK